MRSFKVMRTGNQRLLIEQLLNECKSALANLVGEVADHILETYNEIFAKTPTLVEASLNTKWQDIAQPLIDMVKAMWVANIKKASAADLFGAQTCGGEGKNKQSGVLHRFNHLVFAPTATLFMKFSTSAQVSDEESEADRQQFIRDLKSTPMEAADKTPSQSLKNFINELLRQQCMQLNSQIIGTDGVPKKPPAEGKGLLWWREWFCINKVANWSGSIGAIDTALLKSFKAAAITDTDPTMVPAWNSRALVDVPLATDTSSTLAIVNKVLTYQVPPGKAIGVTNNAMMTRIPVKGDYIVAQLSTPFVKDCPVEAVMDGMGTFGDCYKGLHAPNYHCSDLKVVIEQPYDEEGAKTRTNGPEDNAHEVWGGTDDDVPLRFYFSMDVACGGGGKVAVTYDLQYSNQNRKGSGLGDSEPGSYQSPYLFYTTKIGTGKVDILEANTLLRQALTKIKNQAFAFSLAADGTPNQGLSGAKSWNELFQTPYRITMAKDGKERINTFGYYVMTQFLGDKYMGDFGQGLYVLADKAYNNLLPWAQYRVSADGDRPSYVRNSVIALEATDGVSENSKLFYADSLGDLVSGTFIKRNTWGQIPGISSGGGGKRRTRRRRQRPRKTRRKGQKTKNKKTRIRKRRGKKPTRERNARRRAKTNKRFVFRK